MEKYIKVLRLLEERNWEEMKEWLHEDFMYIKETALSDLVLVIRQFVVNLLV